MPSRTPKKPTTRASAKAAAAASPSGAAGRQFAPAVLWISIAVLLYYAIGGLLHFKELMAFEYGLNFKTEGVIGEMCVVMIAALGLHYLIICQQLGEMAGDSAKLGPAIRTAQMWWGLCFLVTLWRWYTTHEDADNKFNSAAERRLYLTGSLTLLTFVALQFLPKASKDQDECDRSNASNKKTGLAGATFCTKGALLLQTALCLAQFIGCTFLPKFMTEKAYKIAPQWDSDEGELFLEGLRYWGMVQLLFAFIVGHVIPFADAHAYGLRVCFILQVVAAGNCLRLWLTLQDPSLKQAQVIHAVPVVAGLTLTVLAKFFGK